MGKAGTGSHDEAAGTRVWLVVAGLLGCALAGLAIAQNAGPREVVFTAPEPAAATGPAAASAPAKADEVTFHGKAVCSAGPRVPGVKVSITGKAYNPDAEETWTATTVADGTFSIKAKARLVQSASISVDPPADTKFAVTAVLPHQMTTMFRAGDPPEITIVLAPATSKITGAVTDSRGQAVAGASVTLNLGGFGGWWRQTRTVTAGKDGKYEIAGLAAGKYTFGAIEPPAGTALIRLYSWKPGGVRSVELGDKATAEANFTLPAGARLVGRVLDEAGKPVAGCPVTAALDEATEEGPPSMYQMPGQWYSGSATTDAEGRYSIGGLTKETYVVTARAAGNDLAPAVVRGINAPADGDLAVQDLTLYKAGRIVGTVLGADGKPVAGAEASLTLSVLHTRFGSPPTVKATSDAQGKFVIAGLASGRYAVTIKPPWPSPWCEKTVDMNTVAGLSVRHEVKLAEGGKLTGAVTDAEGKGVPGATVSLRYGYDQRGASPTDAEGKFAIIGISAPARKGPPSRDEKWELHVSPPQTPAMLMGASVPLKDFKPDKPNTADVRLTAGAGVSGVVSDADGKPLAGCQVAAIQQVGRGAVTWQGPVLTGPDGKYAIAGIAPGKWSVAVIPPQGLNLLVAAAPQKDLPAGKVETVDVKLKPGATIVGTAVTADGKPLSGAEVTLQVSRDPNALYIPMTDQAPQVAMADDKGQFRFVGLPDGTHKLSCRPLDPALVAEDAEVKVGGPGEVKATVTAQLTGTVAGTVVGADGEPVEVEAGMVNLRLDSLEGRSRSRQYIAYPDKAGAFKFANVLPGRYNMVATLYKKATDKGLVGPAPLEVKVESGKEAKADVVLKPKQDR
ncbi:MAG: carboxypeptidase regulatory-like domain-containing protein [Phycisphaerae bacterium]